MRDYLAWGQPGRVREHVAVAAGVWQMGHYVDTATVSSPFIFIEDDDSFGVEFWESEGMQKQVRMH